ncbi:hypothetical protein DWF04_019140 [Cereibacter sphaeroides f. sp. denitrificans]
MERFERLGPGHHHDRDQEGHDMVDHPVEHERSQQRVRPRRAAERGQDHRLEDAQTRGDVAQDAKADGDGIDDDEGNPADLQILRQEHPEDRGADHEIGRGDGELAYRDAGARHVRPQPPVAAPEDRRRHRQRDEEARRQKPQHLRRETGEARHLIGRHQRRERGGHRQPEAEGEGHEGDHAGDLLAREAEPAVAAIAHRPGRERAEAHGVADRIGAEGDHAHLHQIGLLAEMAQRVDIVAREQDEAHHGEEARDQDVGPGRRLERMQDVFVADIARDPVGRVGHRREDDPCHQREQHGAVATEPVAHGPRPGREGLVRGSRGFGRLAAPGHAVPFLDRPPDGSGVAPHAAPGPARKRKARRTAS